MGSLLDRVEGRVSSTKVEKNYRKPKREDVAKKMRKSAPKKSAHVAYPDGDGCPFCEDYSSEDGWSLGGHVRMAHAMHMKHGKERDRRMELAREIQSGNRAQSTKKAKTARKATQTKTTETASSDGNNVRDLLAFRNMEFIRVSRVGDTMWVYIRTDEDEVFQGQIPLVESE
jgi:hypothetical protein